MYYWIIVPEAGGTKMISWMDDGGGVAQFQNVVAPHTGGVFPAGAVVHNGTKQARDSAELGYNTAMRLP